MARFRWCASGRFQSLARHEPFRVLPKKCRLFLSPLRFEPEPEVHTKLPDTVGDGLQAVGKLLRVCLVPVTHPERKIARKPPGVDHEDFDTQLRGALGLSFQMLLVEVVPHAEKVVVAYARRHPLPSILRADALVQVAPQGVCTRVEIAGEESEVNVWQR